MPRKPLQNPQKNLRVDVDIYEAVANQAAQEGRSIVAHAGILLQIGMEHYRPAIKKKSIRLKKDKDD